MKESIWGYAIIMLGILAIGVIWFFANTTRTDQHNYNLLKETVEAAMFDAVDLAEYRANGDVVIDEEKFVENFIRRFAESADLSNTYVIEIYDVNTKPPKVSLKVSSTTQDTSSGQLLEFNVVNNIDAILETKYGSSVASTGSGFAYSNEKRCIPKNAYSFNIGTEYICKVNGSETLEFYVLAVNGNSVELIASKNVVGAMYKSDRDTSLQILNEEWDIDAKFPTVAQIDALHDWNIESPTDNTKNIEEDIVYPWLYRNLGADDAYWLGEITPGDGYCIYGDRVLHGNVDIFPYRPDCGIRPVISVNKTDIKSS